MKNKLNSHYFVSSNLIKYNRILNLFTIFDYDFVIQIKMTNSTMMERIEIIYVNKNSAACNFPVISNKHPIFAGILRAIVFKG